MSRVNINTISEDELDQATRQKMAIKMHSVCKCLLCGSLYETRNVRGINLCYDHKSQETLIKKYGQNNLTQELKEKILKSR